MTYGDQATNESAKPRRPRLLMVAFACDPDTSMETRIGWRRALQASRWFDVTVLCGPDADVEKLKARQAAQVKNPEQANQSPIDFQRVPFDWFNARLLNSDLMFYQRYRRWHATAFKVAKRLHKQRDFDLAHQVTYCGYREPGLAWKLGIPFVWGPVGGTQGFPLRYLRVTDPLGGLREIARNAINEYQLRFSSRVHQAAKRAAMLAATSQAQADLKRGLGVSMPVELETGLDCEIGPPREKRDSIEPLKILWAGRLRTWKGLPLLLRALRQMPADKPWQLRVLGTGSSGARWKRLANKFGMADRIEWVEWMHYDDTLPHYRWADVFAFTSLRDTSGTGLLESLASGTPIIGIDHQGAADIMDDRSAIRVPASSVRETSEGFRDALATIAGDPDLQLKLSRGAQTRAEDFCWESRAAGMRAIYGEVLNVAGVTHKMASTAQDNYEEEPSKTKPNQPLPVGSGCLTSTANSA